MENLPPLWDHQIKAIDEAKNRDFYGLFCDPGTGKTRTMLEILRGKFNHHKTLLPTVIFAPSVVVPNWKAEIAKYTKIPTELVFLLQGSQRDRIAIVEGAPIQAIFVTNFEALAVMPELINTLEKKIKSFDGPRVLIADEVHKLKDPTSKRTKRAMELAQFFRYRFIMTGTPILNDLMDIYAQFKIMDLGKAFGHNFFSFRARYFEDKNRFMPAHVKFPDWQPLPGAADEIQKKVHENAAIAKKEDCLDLPPLVKKVVEVEMGPEQKRLYNEMKKDFIATFELENVSGEKVAKHSIAELALTKALRLNQIVSGHIKLEGDDVVEDMVVKIKDNPRKKALKELLEDIAPYHKVIVWAVYKSNYEDIKEVCADLGLGFVELTGETKDKQFEINLFEKDKDIRVLIGNPGAGGIGVNLVEASYMIYYSRGFSLEHDIQSEARNYRGGSEKHDKVTRIDLLARGTIDELILNSLESKQKLSEKVLRAYVAQIDD